MVVSEGRKSFSKSFGMIPFAGNGSALVRIESRLAAALPGNWGNGERTPIGTGLLLAGGSSLQLD